MTKFWRVLLILLCSITLVVLLWRAPPKDISALLSTESKQPHYPIAYLTHSNTRQYDKDGQLTQLIKAKYTQHYQYHQAKHSHPDAILDTPNITFFQPKPSQNSQQHPWHISATAGQIYKQQDSIHLTGNVTINKNVSDGTTTSLTTDSLLIKPKQQYAETDKPVIIIDKFGTTKATGLKIFFNEERIELLSNVSNQYTP